MNSLQLHRAFLLCLLLCTMASKAKLMWHIKTQAILASALCATMLLTGCSKEPKTDKDEPLTATAPATGQANTLIEGNAKKKLISTLQANLKKANIDAKILDVRATEVPNIFWVNLEGLTAVFTTADAKYILQGDIVRLGGSELKNIGEAFQAEKNKHLFDALKESDLIVYPAKGKTQHVVYVFTDVSCPYCHKLHEHMPEFNEKGIEVRYIAWPRGEQFLPAMESIWCSKDRKASWDLVAAGAPAPAANCKNPVKDQYKLGVSVGVNGTPAIYSVDGEYLGGYMTPDELTARLDK